MSYFDYFRKEDYLLSADYARKVTNISKYTSVFTRIQEEPTFYTYYNVRGDERLDTISRRVYGTDVYYWTIPLVNSRMTNIWKDGFKDNNSFERWIAQKYPGFGLLLEPTDRDLSGFEIGEIVALNITSIGKILGIYPTSGWIHVQPLLQEEFDVLGIENAWVLLTGLWNDSGLAGEPLRNKWVDLERWRDNPNRVVIGTKSLSSVSIRATVPAFQAPSHYLDADGNRVSWLTPSALPVTVREAELLKNNELSQIKVIRPDFIFDVTSRFRQEMERRFITS